MVYDNFTSRQVCWCRQYLEKTQWWKKRELKRLQNKRLRALLKHAYENVPYYHECFRNSSIRPDDIKSASDLSKLPILKKKTIRQQSGKMVASDFPKRELVPQYTSGTTSSPLGLYRSKADLSWGVGAEFRGYGWAGYEVGDKRALVWGFGPEQVNSFTFRLKSYLMRDEFLNAKHISQNAIASFAERMHSFKPDFVRGYCGATTMFATFLLQSDRYKIRPKVVFTSGETLLPHYRKTIEHAFGCKVYEYYASTEMSHIAAQCGHHEGLHLSEENIVLETVEDSEAAASGEEGKVLLTNLHNYAMPFIRYDIGDMARVFPDTCSCGRGLSLMKPTGRTYEYFESTSGEFSVLRDLETVFEDLPIRDFQVVQESLDEIVIKIVTRLGFTEAHKRFILRNIIAHGPAKIRIELVDSIPLESSGKTRHLVSKIATAYIRASGAEV
jgi:phenylacetate-CoA ligase